MRRCQKEGISSDPLDSLVGPDAIRSRILLQVERSPDVRVALRGLPPMVEEPRAPATPALPATPLFCSPINQYSIKMKTSSALLLACAGSAAAFAPQASNKVRHAEKVFAKETEFLNVTMPLADM